MIERYTRPEMAELWSQDTKYKTWLQVEVWACEAMAELGLIPKEAAEVISAKAAVDADRVDEIEKVTKHDVIAFLTNVAEHVGPEARFIHQGLTSSDVLDTALGLRLTEAADLLLAESDEILAVLKEKAYAYKDQVMVGGPTGCTPNPSPSGLKFALWYADFPRKRKRGGEAPGNQSGGQDFRRGGHLRPPEPGGGGRRSASAWD